MYLLESLRYPFNSRGLAVRTGVACLALLVPVLNFVGYILMFGYGLKIIRRGVSQNSQLPDFDVLNDFPAGFPVLVAVIFHLLPLSLIDLAAANKVPTVSLINAALLLLLIMSLLVFSIGLIRYAVTRDIRVFLDVPGSCRILYQNPLTTLVFFVNVLALAVLIIAIFSAGMLAVLLLEPSRIGYVFFILLIPRIFIVILTQFSMYRLVAHFGMRLGFQVKEKVKTGY